MATSIHRITLFNIPDPDDISAVVDKYATLAADAKKDGKTYIISAKAAAAMPDPARRNQGYTVVANTVFASLDDMKYYDEDCAAHRAIKEYLRHKLHGVLTVFSEDREMGSRDGA